MNDYAGRVLADRYRLPRTPRSDAPYEPVETRAYDTYSGQEVHVRQVPLPEVVEAEVVGAEAIGDGGVGDARAYGARPGSAAGGGDPAVRRAIEAVKAAAALPDHPRLGQVFDVFADGGSLWIVSELLRARPLAALLAERPLPPHRAAEVAADLLAALRTVHAHGWTHGNITPHTVLICDDGRAILTGLGVGAAQEALCGYDPLPRAAGAAPEVEPGGEPAAGAAAGSALGTAPGRRREPGGGRGREGRAGEGAVRHGLPVPRVGDGAADGPAGSQHAEGGAVWGAGGEVARGVARREAPASGEGPVSGAGPAGSCGGPRTPLAAERAREARMVVVGALAERWAPEVAGRAYADGELRPGVGAAADFWALGVLLFRAVQGRGPYPEESAAELVELVRTRAAVFADSCGPLRPVVESLLRQDPDERPGAGELGGRLAAIVREAPEPELGRRTVTLPSLGSGEAADPRRLPIVRRRGELVRRRSRAGGAPHGRHRRGAPARKDATAVGGTAVGRRSVPVGGERRSARAAAESGSFGEPEAFAPVRMPKSGRPGAAARGRTPRGLGRTLVGLVLLAMIAAIAYAVLFMPKAGDRAGAAGATGAPDASTPASGRGPDATQPQSAVPPDLADGFALRQDPAGFALAVRDDWRRRGENDRGQIRYLGGDHELIVVPGRDSVRDFGGDPLAYQQDGERELAAFREAQWSSASGLRRIDVGRTAMAEGTFTWKDSSGRRVYARNLAMIVGGRYHLLLAIGPDGERDAVDRFYEQAADTYRPTAS
ncbi:serine/threonine protein kinase [Streptomyces pathocidini]|uniref:Serine/threonine protein kinase n=1 Tax=Streptomyces pathocidini TaxID=1650571 RepID=A0ABW7UVW6_9ACTN